MQYITENSIYSYQKQICEGYITLKGGHRVGISGNVVYDNEKVININYIYSLNFRISKEIIGVARDMYNELYLRFWFKLQRGITNEKTSFINIFCAINANWHNFYH